MADTYALLEEGVRHGIARVLEEYDLEPLLKTLPEERAFELGLDAARHALAPLIWRALVGEALDTEHVRELLGVTRQALYQRVERGTLLGLPGERTTLFPVWQFDDGGARAVTSQIVSAFRDALEDDYEPLLVASWAVTPQPELDDRSPQDWLATGGAEEPVVVSAKRAAQALAR